MTADYLPDVAAAGTAPPPPAAAQQTPPDGANAQAPARARTREARLATAQAAARQVLTGASAWESAPPSLAVIWAHHSASARYYSAALVRYPRYAFGGAHIGVAALAYLLVLATDSAWKILGLAAVLALLVWLL